MLGDRARGFEVFDREFGDFDSWPNVQRISRNRPKAQRMPDQRSNFLRRTDNRSNVLKRPDHGMNILRSYHGPNMLRRTDYGSNMLRRTDHGSNFLTTSNELKRSGHYPNVQWRTATVHPIDVTWPEKDDGLPVRNRPGVWTDDYWVEQQLYQPYGRGIG